MTSVFPPDRPNPPDLVPFAEARAGVLERLSPLPVREVALTDALGCVLADDIAAGEDLPPFDASAMDGFAVPDGVFESRITCWRSVASRSASSSAQKRAW
jgi:molybdopterin biosynthesis enzyme